MLPVYGWAPACRVILLSGLFLTLVLAPGRVSADLTPGDHIDRVLAFGGESRLYDVHVPPGYDGTSPVALILDIHGLTSNKTQQAIFSGFKALSDVEGFIVAYPQGLFGDPNDPEAPNGTLGVDPLEALGPCWNAGIGFGLCKANQVDDVGFLRALVMTIAEEANIDLRRVYATGLSNGAAMSHALACHASDLFAAVAPLAFPLPFVPLTDCQPPRPIPVLHFAGIDDLLVPFGGCSPETVPCGVDSMLTIPSADSSFERWRELNGCIGNPDPPAEIIFVQGTSGCETDTSCDAGVHTGLCSINGASLPLTPSANGHLLYLNEDGLDLAQMAWDFLSQFEAPASTSLPALPGWGTSIAAALLMVIGLWHQHRRRPGELRRAVAGARTRR